MTLHEYAAIYLAERPGLSVGYGKLLPATVRKFCAFLGRDPAIEELDRVMLADWARHLLASGNRPRTVNGKLAMIRTLLVAAYDDELLDRPPRRVRKLQEHLPPPEAWTVDECRRLLAHLASLHGRVGERPACDWWFSLALTIYWTGCRIGALLRSRVEDYEPGVGLVVRRQKNGRQQFYSLPPACCESIDRVLPEAGLVWRWPYHRRTFWTHFRQHVEAAGLPAPRTHGQLFHRLRRTNASYCAAVDPAIAQRQMDHADLKTTTEHYIDPRIARQVSAADVLPDPMPPDDERPTFKVVG